METTRRRIAPGLQDRGPGWAAEQTSASAHQQGRSDGPTALPSEVTFAKGTRLLRNRSPQGEEEAMKFFTPDLINRFGSEDDRIAVAAHQEFEERSEEYLRHLHEIEEQSAATLPGAT